MGVIQDVNLPELDLNPHGSMCREVAPLRGDELTRALPSFVNEVTDD